MPVPALMLRPPLKRPIVVHLCAGPACRRTSATYADGGLPRGWKRVGRYVVCDRCVNKVLP